MSFKQDAEMACLIVAPEPLLPFNAQKAACRWEAFADQAVRHMIPLISIHR